MCYVLQENVEEWSRRTGVDSRREKWLRAESNCAIRHSRADQNGIQVDALAGRRRVNTEDYAVVHPVKRDERAIEITHG